MSDLNSAPLENNLPLCVDMDGTLIYTDLTVESLLAAIKQKWWIIFLAAIWIFKGRPFLKQKLNYHFVLFPERLPYNYELIDYLKQEKKRGRRILLVTGSYYTLAEQVAAHVGIFDEVIATHEENCTGHNKGRVLRETFGEKGFVYAGNSMVDLPVWQLNHSSIVVNAQPLTLEAAQRVSHVEKVFAGLGKWTFKDARKGLRIQQWMKNLLVFVPLLTAHQITNPYAWGMAALAFLFMSTCASATYILNDLLDLNADRIHPKKCHRPFASGKIPIPLAVFWAMGLFLFSLLSLVTLPHLFFAVLATYLLLTLAYSFRLKRMQSFDVVSLALLYTLRVIAGAVAIQVPVSFWLLAFSLFIFLSLGIVKRVSELQRLISEDGVKAEGRGYSVHDLDILKTLGASSGYIAVLVICLYINSKDVLMLYPHPERLWLLCPLILIWITRIWVLCGRGKIDEDPVEFAVKDPYSWWIALIAGAIIIIASLFG
ncbi:MAG: UbiA family prenyltransferase [Pseudomonadota bacterium]